MITEFFVPQKIRETATQINFYCQQGRRMRTVVAVALLAFVSCCSAENCGYESCHPTKDDRLNVHLVPHTHDDVGWLQTVDQYYVGIDHFNGVKYILDTVVQELSKDPTKRFIYVEMAFFWRWWREQDDATRHVVKGLVSNGQLEFINGGWSMNDEAATHYNAIVDQMTLGFKFLEDTFGSCARPRVAWHIDPFGHSKEQANLFAEMGFDGFFFARLDYDDKNKRLKEKTMEMLWKPRPNQTLFTGALFGPLYGPPEGFCYEASYCSDPPIVDDPNLKEYNADERVAAFVEVALNQAKYFRTNNIMLTMGMDFNYANAHIWFSNMDKLIRLVNANSSQIHVLYSTPSCYLKALNEAQLTWPTKNDDFFPYANDPHAFWTGYFTSRPALKGMIRQANNLLQVCKQMDASLAGNASENVAVLSRAVGVNQHHDAVTGTAKQAVTFDYAERLYDGYAACDEVTSKAYAKHQGSNVVEPCHLLNISQCDATQSGSNVVVNVYNPLIRTRDKFVRFPVSMGIYSVRDPDGNIVEVQLVPIAKPVMKIPGRRSQAAHELVFKATDLPPLGFKSYFVSKSKGSTAKTVVSSVSRFRESLNVLQSGLTFNKFGQLKQIGNTVIRQGFGWYEGHAGNNSKVEWRASGAYIFRPKFQRPSPLKKVLNHHVVNGPLVNEVHQEINPWLSQVIRSYRGQEDTEFQWLVGPIPIEDGKGKEVIVTFEVPTVRSARIFYTDSNGRQMVERIRNYRPTWKLNQTEPVSQNYYPVNSRICLKDDAQQVTVLNDRSQGGTSMKDGQIELMIHRRLLHDDAFGVGEALNETAFGKGLVVTGKHWLQLSHPSSASKRHRLKAEEIFMDVQLSFVRTSKTFQDWKAVNKMNGTLFKLRANVTDNVHLLTIEKRTDKEMLLRLEHQFDVNEDAVLSKPVTLDLNNLFEDVQVSEIRETALGANVNLDDLQRLKWNEYADKVSIITSSMVTLNPMQIRTFILTVA